MDEEQQYAMGCRAEDLLADDGFNEIISLCETQLSLQMLDSDTSDKREEIHRTYLGLKAFLGMMQQFVIMKDQIAAHRELEQQNKRVS